MINNFQFIPINQDLYPHANYLWVMEGTGSATQPYKHAVVPNGVSTLLYIYEGSFTVLVSGQRFEKGELVLCGPNDRMEQYLLDGPLKVFAICLQPYVLPLWMGLSGEKLLNTYVPSADLAPLNDFKRNLQLTQSNNQRIEESERFLEIADKKIDSKDPKFLKVVKDMFGKEPKDLQSIVDSLPISTRQFQRKFKSYTGFTPIQFLRITRLQTILDQSVDQSLTQLALQFGYYDQAHFINDFKKLAGGITPSQYFEGVKELKWKSLGESVAFFQS